MAVKSFAEWSSEKKKKKVQQGEEKFTPSLAKAAPKASKPKSFTEWSTQKKARTLVNGDYINTFLTDADNFMSSVKDEYDSLGWDNASTAYESCRTTLGDLNQRAKYIRSWLDQRRMDMDENTVKALLDSLNAYDSGSTSILDAYKNAADYYGQFDSEESYNSYVKAKEEYDKNMSDFTPALEAADYAQLSKVDKVTIRDLIKSNSVMSTDVHTYINADQEARKHMTMIDTEPGWLSEPSELHLYNEMTEDEIGIYNYYYAKEGQAKADEYLERLKGYLEERQKGTIYENAVKLAEDSPVGASLTSVLMSLGSGREYVKDALSYAFGEEETLDYNAMALASSSIRGTVSEDVSWEIAGWDAGQFLYNTGMSMADSAAGLAFGNFGGTVLGLSAAAQGTNDALDRGMNDEQAFWNGMFSGVFEGVFETWSIGKFNALKEVTPITFKDIAKNIGKSMLTNASEETLTEIANIVYDTIMNGEFANYTWEDLKNGAWKDALLQVVESGASGALMGIGFGGGGSAIGYVKGSKAAKQTYGGSQNELISAGLESPEGSYSRALAEKYQIKVDSGKSLSGGQLNRLVQANEQAFRAEDIASIKQATAQRLTELGETGDVDLIAAAVAKQVSGEKLTKAEKKALESSTYGGRVTNELNPKNIESGEYSGAWAQKIDTQRINVDEYSRLAEAAEMPAEGENTVAEELPAESSSPANAQAVETVETPAATVRENLMVDPAKGTNVPTKAAVTEEAEETETVSLDKLSKKYGAQAGAMLHTYTAGQDVESYDRAYGAAYDMGKSGVALSYAMESESTAYLTENQRTLAYEAGKAASENAAREQDAANKAKANGKKGHRKGTVKGEGVKIADLKKTFNDPQGKAFKYLSTVAEITGIDIVLYKSEAGESDTYEGSQGKFKWSEDTIYIDVNAGLYYAKDANTVAKYAMLRTFSHEFTHFIEKWNPIWYNELRKVVFDTLTEQGENVHELIEEKQSQSEGMTYDEASREVVAESMTDILPDANFVRELAEKHQNIFQKLLEQLKEFVENLRAYFNGLVRNPSREANALKKQVGETVRYMENIVNLFDRVAVDAVENYQQTVATEEVAISKTENTTIDTATVSKVESVAEESVVSESETTTEKAQTEEYDHFTITDDAKGRVISIKFDGKPVEAVREVLKANAFVWNKTKGEWFRSGKWYNKNKATDVVSALQKAYAEEKPVTPQAEEVNPEAAPAPEAQAPAEVESKAEEKAPETKDAYSQLSDKLSAFNVVKENGLAFFIYGNEKDGYYGTIKRLREQPSAYPIENARDRIYKSAVFENRQEAVDDIVLITKISDLLTPKEATNTVKEENENVETPNADHRETVQQSVPDGQGTAPVLDESQTGDVPGDAQRGNSVADAGERGQQTPQSGSRSGERTEIGSGSSEGNSESTDLRRDDGLTAEEPSDVTDTNVGDKAAEELHEEVAEQIARQSTEQPKGRNFVIGDSLDLPSGEKSRYKANVEAIRLVKQLEAENRYATEAEQVILSKYVGWGGLANAFDQRKNEWAKEYAELKELLTKEEYESARGSTLNAHYTDISVIKAMYDGLASLGFNGGRLLEPSSGVGNFVGAMPAEMSAKVKSWTMVELDGITGLIAKYLYPNADVRIQGFEKANIPDNYMDVAISNVPFGNYAIADKAYPKKVTSAIHNYFFAKSLDKVRPGGIVMFITSSFTMNAQDTTVRRYIIGKADLLGAIRLPSNAFKGNAGTEVVTDILILKKRAAGTTYAGEDFLESPWGYPVKGNHNGAYVNNYFANHPEMVLGTPSMEGGMYRSGTLTYKAFEDRGSLGDQIREAFTHIVGKMDYPAKQSPEKVNFANERAGKKTKQDGYVVKEGKIYQNKDGELVEQKLAKGVADRIAGLLSIRDAAKELMNAQQQGQKDSEIKKARTKLNKLYDAFVEKNGYINAPANRNAIKEDPDCYSLYALENWNPETKKAVKADLFSKNTIAPNRTVTSANDVSEGLIVSVNQTGGVDVDLIAKLVGKDADAVTRELIDSRKAFKNRDGALEPAEVYLSGNVRAKLRDAEALVPMDADYQKNVDALKAVMPEDVGYQDIFVNPGTPWIPSSVYSDFAAYMLGSSNYGWRPAVDITRNAETGNFIVELKDARLKHSASNTQKWGTSRRSFLELFDAMLNSKSIVIKKEGADGKSVVDKDATDAANEKIENITKEFQEWLWKDEARRNELATLYNEVFNSIVTPKYNGDNLTVNGANALKPLRAHQRDAVQRVISSGGNTLLAHKVGAGKTYEMAAAAMKLKELGLVKKPMFAVPKSLVAQWGVEFKDFFPTAKLLVAEASDFTAANRKVFMNRIASGDYDAVIVSYEQFEKLPVSDDFTRELYQEQIDSVIAAIEDAKAEKGAKSLSIKDLEKKRKSLQTKIDKLTDKAKDEGNIDFEQLGIDSLFIDEAHNFKNLFYTTSMTNVAGLGNKDGSKRAFDLYTKVRYLQKLNGGRGIVFATATPVMNSMSEMYIMQKYLQPDLLDQLGLSTFDAWAKQFGEVVNGVEIKPSGQGYRVKQSFSRFKNMSELQLLFRNFADVLTDIPGLKIPKLKGGKVNVVVCEPGEYQQNYMKELEQRADSVKNVDPSVDNMLKITSDGRKISYTQRMIDPSLPYEEGCKIYRCADNVVERYRDSKSVKGTQLIFCDMATPKGKSQTTTAETEEVETDMESARLYDDIRQRLIEGGIPAKEIAFIHDADTDQKKKKLFADVNDGKVRVLIGSTGKMGVGMNAQKRVVAIHHLDAPWRPGDVEQRNGRAFRQGNINDEVECFTYVTEGSFDARLWDILERKQNFINQIMNGESVGREAEDTGEVTLSAAEVKALASGSPLIIEQVQLDTDIKKLEGLYRSHVAAVRNARERHVADKGRIETLEGYIADGKADIAARKDTYSEGKFLLKIGKSNFFEKKDAGIALMAEATAKAVESGYTTIASFAGFDLRVVKTHEGIKGLISGKQAYPFNTYPGNTSFMVNHLIAKVEGLDETVKGWEQELSRTRADLAEQEKLMAEPFAKEAELNQKRLRYKEIMEILNPKEEQAIVEDTVQEQNREYLSSHKYSYEWFTQKPDMAVTSVDDSVKYDRAEIVSLALKNAASVGYTNKNGNAVVHVTDIDTDVIVPKRSLVHGLDRRINTQAPVLVRVGDVLQNAIRVNELVPRAKEIQNAYVLIGAARNQDGNLYIVSFVVNKYSNEVAEIDVLYSANAKKESAALLPKFTDKSATPTNSNISIAHLLDSVNRHFPDVLPEDVLRHYGHEARPDGTIGKDALYQQRRPSLTDREVLAMAADEVYQKIDDLNAAEQDALRIFKERLHRLDDLQEQRAEQGRLYKDQQFGAKVDRVAAAETLNRMHTLDEQIQKASADLLTVEEKTVLKQVLQKARKVVEAEERQHGKEILARWRDRRNNAAAIKKYRDRLRGDVDDLTNWVLHPNNKDIVKHIPDALKNSVIPFLSSINFMSKRSLAGGDPTVADKEFMNRLKGLKNALRQNADTYGLYSGYNDLPPDFMERLQTFIDAAQTLVDNNSGEFIINQMTSDELRELSKVVRTLKEYIKHFNRFHANAMYQHVYEAGNDTIQSLGEMKSDGGKSGTVSNFVLWQQMRPAYAFERFGRGGVAIYDGLRRGQAKLAFNTKEIQSFAEKAYTAKEVQAWEKEIKTINLGGDTVKIPVSMIMSFYELSKQTDSLRHMLGGGIRVATTKIGKQKISDIGHIITEQDVVTIISTLSDRQKEVADALQKYMAEQGGKWGNYVSVVRFGEELFGNPQYFPINSDGRYLQSTADENPSAASLYALLNMSFTKSRNEHANNRIILYSIFDVFANHMASMAQYNAMALPVLDAIKWFNYQQKSDADENGKREVLGSVRDQMSRVYGVPEETRPGSGKQGYAETFVMNILKAFNGTEAQGSPYDSLGLKMLHNYNIAQVAYNLRVVVQQPLAITRAALLIDYNSILRGMKLSPAAIQQNITEMQQYSGIAAWKSLGFYDTNISHGLTDIIKHDSNLRDKITEKGMWLAEKADTLTWAAIWSACKEEVIHKQRISSKNEGFYEAVTQLFEDVIYKTQVVDSILTKNEFMRSKGFFSRMIGSFMSEPTTTASMLVNAYDNYSRDLQRGMSKQGAWQKNRKLIIRTAYVYGIGAVLLAAVQAAYDALRDDDEYEEFSEKWLEAFWGNLVDELMPFNKLPILSQFYEFVKELISVGGFDIYGQLSNFTYVEIAEKLIQGVEIIYDKITDEDTNYTWYGGAYKLLQAISGMTGLPMASATREIITAWNNTVGAMAPSLKVHTYDSGDKNAIKYAYMDGYLTAEEAMALLIEKGLADTEDEAYFTIQEWDDADGSYSRYDKVYDAILNSGDFDSAMDELTSHGYTEEDVLKQVKSQIGKWYYDEESKVRITKQQAVSMLEKYTDMESDEITATVNRWSSKVVTGIAYDEIDDAFMEGTISAERAKEMYVRYGSMTAEKAAEKVTVLAFVKEHPAVEGISYTAVESYTTYCEGVGMTAEVFWEAWQYNSATKADVDENGDAISGSKKVKVLAYIDSLNLSARQKDSLYYAFGWAESKINEAPWR